MEQPIRIAAQLYEARDTAKFMLGANYHAKLEPWIGMIKASAKNRGVSELKAAGDLAKDVAANISGAAAITVLAAYVELIEPSNVQGNGLAATNQTKETT